MRKIEEMHKQGKSIKEISEAYNVSIESIIKFSKIVNVDLEHRKISCCKCHKNFKTEVDEINIPINRLCPKCLKSIKNNNIRVPETYNISRKDVE
jgi:NAD-dependent SIR2 family protein deacetylase